MTTDRIILGTVQFGCEYGINSAGHPDTDMVREILKEADRSGIRTLDTSSAYGNAESVLGECMPAQSDFNIISKYPKQEKPVNEVFNESLTRLNTKHLYGYMMHHFSIYREHPSVWNDFIRLRDNGLVDRIGFSLYSPEELEIIFNDNIDFNLVQIPRNIFDRKFDPYLPELKRRGVEIHVRSTFLQGLFFKNRESLPEKLLPLKKYLIELDSIARDSAMSITQLALGFNIYNDLIDKVLIGVDNVNQLRDNIDSIPEKPIIPDINVMELELLNPVNWN